MPAVDHFSSPRAMFSFFFFVWSPVRPIRVELVWLLGRVSWTVFGEIILTWALTPGLGRIGQVLVWESPVIFDGVGRLACLRGDAMEPCWSPGGFCNR